MTHKSFRAFENGTCDCAQCRAPMTDNRKQSIIAALRAFVEQRPGFDLHNYATMRDYRQDQRRAQRQLHDARELLRAVEDNQEISADDLLKAADSGRLSITQKLSPAPHSQATQIATGWRIDYCPGQYWCTEFRAGVCRVLASALWAWQREHMPEPNYAEPRDKAEHTYPNYETGRYTLSAGDWLRATFRQRFGKGFQSRWFD